MIDIENETGQELRDDELMRGFTAVVNRMNAAHASLIRLFDVVPMSTPEYDALVAHTDRLTDMIAAITECMRLYCERLRGHDNDNRGR